MALDDNSYNLEILSVLGPHAILLLPWATAIAIVATAFAALPWATFIIWHYVRRIHSCFSTTTQATRTTILRQSSPDAKCPGWSLNRSIWAQEKTLTDSSYGKAQAHRYSRGQFTRLAFPPATAQGERGSQEKES